LTTTSFPSHSQPTTAEWKEIVAKYQEPSTGRASWQLVNSVGPYVLMWALMYWSLSVSWWLTVPLAILAGTLLVRVFIIFHDCGHGSFFKSKLANDLTGFFAGVLNLTSYHHWRWEHSLHHASSGNLDKRGTGDVWTMTVEEYLASPRWKRWSYRFVRNPFVLLFLAPLFLFAVLERFPSPKANVRERRAIWLMNAVLLAVAIGLSMIFGWKEYLLIQLIVTMTAGAGGVWMFYVQHQFEDTYWERRGEWDYTTAALQGSSFYKLPRILQYLSGNIGFHHIHHLSPRIANYNLERCHNSHPIFQDVVPLTLRTSFKCLSFRLWDEEGGRLIGFGELPSVRRRRKAAVREEELVRAA
jgi:omega-6 fatty acid desaturase (delta-12 desaturase)